MSWHYSQALVAAYSADTCSAGAQSAQSSGSLIPALYCAPDRMKVFSRLSRFGMTCEPLTDELGADVLTWCLAASPVRTSAQPAKAPESTESVAECGRTWRESFARWDHVTSSWKTRQCSLLVGLDVFSETWPQWGMMRGGECSVQTMPALHTGGTGSGLWPTPTVHGNYNRKGLSATSGDGLATAVSRFPTPTACMSKGSSLASLTRKSGRSMVNDRLDHNVMASHGGSLNPTWVEWLMGWPLAWTDLKPSGTDKFRQWQNSHGKPSQETSNAVATFNPNNL